MRLFDKYRFIIKIPNEAETVIYPKNDNLAIKWTRDKDFRFFRWEMVEELLLTNDDTHSTYNKLADLEIGADPCQPVYIRIERKCKGESDWSEFWKGTLARVDRKYNNDDCEIRVKPRTDDNYTCLLDGWEFERSIFDIVNKTIEATTFVGNIEYATCSDDNRPDIFPGYYARDCISGQTGWRVVDHRSFDFRDVVRNTTKYAREVVYGGPEPPGGGWTLEGDKWVRPLVVVLKEQRNNNQGGQGARSYFEIWDIANYTIDNGVLLNDILLGFGQYCGFHNYGAESKFISNFFGIAPDGTQPDNAAYTSAIDNLYTLAVWQITDIAKHGASTNASNGPITFKKLLKDLKVMFNIDFYVDSDGVFRLEHFSYFRKEKRLDLTQPLWVKYLKGRGRFEFDKEKIPIKEKFFFADVTRYDFDGVPIEYQPECSDPDREENYKCEALMSDIEYIIQNPDKWEESPLFVIAALQELNGGYYFKFESTPFNTRALLNGHLSFPNLHENYHQYGRPQEFGRMNLAWRKFSSFKFMKLQDELQFPFGCCDISLFEPEDLVKANFGWSEVEEASYNLKSEIMTMQLRF